MEGMLWLEPIHLGSVGILILFRIVRVLYTAWWGMSNHFNNTNHRKERLLGMCQPRKVHSAIFFQWQKSCQSGSIQRTVSDRKTACLKQWNGRKVGWDFLNHLGKDKWRGIEESISWQKSTAEMTSLPLVETVCKHAHPSFFLWGIHIWFPLLKTYFKTVEMVLHPPQLVRPSLEASRLTPFHPVQMLQADTVGIEKENLKLALISLSVCVHAA